MNKAAIIIPWYGKLPPYLGFYLKSLEGKQLDVLWVSDLAVGDHPENFKIVPLAFEELLALMQKKLETPVSVARPLRLSDFKPMYGKILEDYIDQYEYWGWGDCDLVYGEEFNGFLSRVLCRSEYDIISMHKAYLSGPFCLCRNTSRLRELFHDAGNWKEMCAHDGVRRFLFDECGGEFHEQLSSGAMSMADCSKNSDSFSAVVWRTPNLSIYREDEITESSLANGDVVEMDDGKLSIDGRKIAVFHYILAKVPRYFRYVNVPYGKVGHYRIDRTGFYTSEFAWTTRCIHRPWRMSVAAWGSLRKYGFNHVLKRLGLKKMH